jgi:WD40-like Beta Propeller Repeat
MGSNGEEGCLRIWCVGMSRRSGSALIAVLAAVLACAVWVVAPARAANIHVFDSSIGGSSTPLVDQLSGPTDVAIDESSAGAHDLYVTDPGHFRVEKFDSSGNFLLMFGKGVNKTKVEAKASEAEQNVCVAGSGDECQSGTQGGEGGGEFSNPQFVAVDNSESASAGDVYVGDAGTATVYKFGANGSFISATEGSGATRFTGIDGVAVDGSGKLWVYDQIGIVYRFEVNGTPVAETFNTNGARPSGLAVDNEGDFYVVQGLEDLAKFSASGHLIGEVTPTPVKVLHGGKLVTGVALDLSTDDLYAGFGGEIGHIQPGCEPESLEDWCTITDFFGFPALQSGRGLAVDSGDNAVFAADEAANLVDRFVVGLEAFTGAAGETTASEATVHGTVNPEGATVTECGFEYGPTEEYGQSIPCQESVGSGVAAVGVHARLQGLKGGTTYHYRVFARNSAGVLRAEDGTFATSPTALVEEVAARDVTASTAELVAKINPEGLGAHYRFEYGTSTAYSTSVPVPDQDIGAGSSGVEVSQAISGLQPNTTYHFRVVATDANGATESIDHTFVFLVPEHAACPNEALRAGLAANLPDCRGYEMVTPAQKNAALIGAILFGPSFPAIAEDGSHMIVPSVQCFAEAESCTAHRGSEGQLYEFSRGSGTWQTNPLAPPATQFQTESLWSYGVSANSFLFSTPGAQGADEFYARQTDGTYRLIGPIGEGAAAFNVLAATGLTSTADFSHLVYATVHPVWSFDHEEVESHSVYEYTSASSTAPSLVGVSGGPGSTDLIGTCGTGIGAGTLSTANFYNPLSEDGRILYFTVRPCATGSGANAGKPVPAYSLYERVDQSRTIAVSTAVAATCTTSECQGSVPADAVFEGASRDGQRVVFTSTQQLTDQANQDRRAGDTANRGGQNGCAQTAPSASGCNLYLSECPDHCEDPSQRKLIDVSEGAKDGGGPRVQGVVALSPDGGHVFFVAKGALTTAKNKLGEGAQVGAENLYSYERDEAHPQGRLSFVARLSVEDQPNWAGGEPFHSGEGEIPDQGLGVANLTPDGRYLVFASTRALTADAAPGPAQVYRYDSQSEEMTRISVGQGGFNDNGNAGKAGANAGIAPAGKAFALGDGPAHTNPTMSNDGSYVFFQSPVALTPGALNEAKIGSTSELALNVYEYHEGVVSLISDGKDVAETGKILARSPELLGTDASGEDVFFATNSQLTAKDTDTQRDYYDARVGGGEEAQAVVPSCEGDACRQGGSVPPPFGPLTSTLTGPSGNVTPAAPVSPPGPASKPKPPTKKQLLEKALKSCRTKYKAKKKKKQRAACERSARKRFAAKPKPKSGAARHKAQRSSKKAKR